MKKEDRKLVRLRPVDTSWADHEAKVKEQRRQARKRKRSAHK